MPTLIGLTGRIGSGKTACADHLVTKGFIKDAYATSLKKAVSVTFGVPLEKFYGTPESRAVVDPYWGISYREMMQRFGTEACRKTFGDEFWVKNLWRHHDDPRVMDEDLVIEDVRFPSEAKAVIKRCGVIIEIIRPRCEPDSIPWWKYDNRKEHASEKPLPSSLVHYQIFNDASLGHLHLSIESALRFISEK